MFSWKSQSSRTHQWIPPKGPSQGTSDSFFAFLQGPARENSAVFQASFDNPQVTPQKWPGIRFHAFENTTVMKELPIETKDLSFVSKGKRFETSD